MYPDDQNPHNPYEFIVNPQAPGKKGLRLPGVKDPFFAKIVFVIVGVVVVLGILGALLSFAFKGKQLNTADLVGLVQTQQELVRLSAQGLANSSHQSLRDLSITVQLSVDTNRLQLIDYLKQNGRKITTQELTLKHSTTTDTRIASALQVSTFDSVYVQLMQNSLVAYKTEIEEVTNRATGTIEKQLLAKTANTADLLLKQVPTIESVQPGS